MNRSRVRCVACPGEQPTATLMLTKQLLLVCHKVKVKVKLQCEATRHSNPMQQVLLQFRRNMWR